MKPCEHLYCKKNDSDMCHSEYSPWADGTKCGERRYSNYMKIRTNMSETFGI